MQGMRLMIIYHGMTGKRMGKGMSARKMKALYVKMETVTLIGKSR